MAGSILSVDESNFEAEVLHSPIPVLVDFWAPWCGPCIQMNPVLEALAKEKEGKAKIVKVNVDDCRNLAVQQGVNAMPTFIFFHGGKEKDRHVGASGKQALSLKLEALS